MKRLEYLLLPENLGVLQAQPIHRRRGCVTKDWAPAKSRSAAEGIGSLSKGVLPGPRRRTGDAIVVFCGVEDGRDGTSGVMLAGA